MIWSALQWLAKYLGTFLTAFVLALIVWVLAVINADPNISCPAPTSIPLEVIGQDTRYLLLGTLPESIDIQLRAPRSVCERLASEPGAVLASIDLSTLEEGDHSLNVIPQISEQYRPVRIMETSPQLVSFTLEAFEAQILPLQWEITGQPAPGFTEGAMTLSEYSVTISGRKSLVDLVDQAVVTLDITDAQQEIITDRPVELKDINGNPVSGVTINPETVSITQIIERPSTYREVTVKVITAGQPAEGYRLTNIASFPQVVTIFSSNPDLVREMPGFVETTPITLTEATDDIEQRVFLVLPEGVSIAGEQSVLVQISIAAIESSLPLSLNVEVIGLSPGLQVLGAVTSVDLIISGPLPTLETLQLGDIRVVLDLTGLEIGQYTIH
ncbi:MAG: hypothetical protein HC806_07950, partial [Anaerolineae bacterium]|nr:hypothetical protein [Anaerolineae bacterium]